MAPSSMLFAAAALLPSAFGRYTQASLLQTRDNSSSTCSNPQLSCHNTTAVSDTCCFESPGGSLLQVQLWDTNPSEGPDDSWTIHGLWPDECNGNYVENCDPSRAYTNITAILQEYGKNDLLNYMNTYWLSDDESNEDFWAHEWGTHGTCISTLEPSCFSDYQTGEEVPAFFQTVVDLFQTLPTYTWLSDAGITPDSSQTYALSDIQNALSSRHGNGVYIQCDNNALISVYYTFNIRGSVQNGTFVSAPTIGSSSDGCDSQVQYLPKN